MQTGSAQRGEISVTEISDGDKKKRGTPPAKLRRLTRIFANFYKVIKIIKKRQFLTIFDDFRDPRKTFVRKMPKSEKRDIFAFEIGHKMAISDISRGIPAKCRKSPKNGLFWPFLPFFAVFRHFSINL